MSEDPRGSADPQSQQLLLSIWDDEGGAGRGGPKESTARPVNAPVIPDLTNTELVQLRVRVIALENLVTALLWGAQSSQHDLVRAMAARISPPRRRDATSADHPGRSAHERDSGSCNSLPIGFNRMTAIKSC